ncbi:MAG: hypothetical protein NT038_06435 [Euryarchaeota archaeon]|nr:hypothetical protein [Euryarchaeota archaeon]
MNLTLKHKLMSSYHRCKKIKTLAISKPGSYSQSSGNTIWASGLVVINEVKNTWESSKEQSTPTSKI